MAGRDPFAFNPVPALERSLPALAEFGAMLAIRVAMAAAGFPGALAVGRRRAGAQPFAVLVPVASWSSSLLGTSEGLPTISGSTEPICVRSRLA